MKTVAIEEATVDAWIEDAQGERVVITRNGRPVALVVGIEGMDLEQIELGSSDPFWSLIAERRAQKPVSRAELEEKMTLAPDS